MKYSIIILIFFSFQSLIAQIKYPIDKKYKAVELYEDLDVFIQAYKDIYPSLYRYRSKQAVDSLLLIIRANIIDNMTEMDFYNQISSFCSFIGDVHSEVIPSKSYLKFEKETIKKLPFKFIIINEKFYIIENYSDDNSIKAGCEILSINSKPVQEIINEIIPHIATDGYNQTYKYHYLTKYFGRYYTRLIDVPDLYDLEIIELGEKDIKKITINAKTDKEIKQIRIENYPYQKYVTLEFRKIDNQISYLRISSFNNDSKDINDIQFENFIDSVFTLLKDNRTPNLIIDLRWNGGGDDKNGALLYSYLTDKPFRYYDCLCVAITADDIIKTQNYFEYPEEIDEFKKYVTIDSIGRKIIILDDHPNTAIQKPQTINYKGNVYIIINGKSSSATSEFCAITKYHKRGVFIGEETGGGFYGNTSGWDNILIFPNTKLQFQMSFMEYRSAVLNSNIPKGHGIIPDYKITPDVRDIINNVDKELKFTIDLINKKN